MSPTGYIILRQPPSSTPLPHSSDPGHVRHQTTATQCLHIFHSLPLANARLDTYVQQFRAAEFTVEEYCDDASKDLRGYKLRDGVTGGSEGAIWIDSAGVEDTCETVGEKRNADRVIGRAVFC